MKILIVNYHYFIHGGPDRYFFNIKHRLESLGHTVIPFSFNYDETLLTPFRCYFPEPISGKGSYLLGNLKLSPAAKVRYAARMFYNPGVRKAFRKLLKDTRPDIVYSIYLSSSMLPDILDIAKKEFDIPVFYRLSDFHMFCPSYLFYRDGAVCTECCDDLSSAIRHSCVQGSKFASLLRVMQMRVIRWAGWYDYVDSFVCPSRVMQEMLIQSGIKKERCVWIPTFANDLAGPADLSHPYILYYGKLIPEKGLDILLQAYNKIQSPLLPLRMVGHVSDSYRARLESYLDDQHKQLVTFEQPLRGEAMWQTLRGSAFVVQPGTWLENMPNTLVEAFSAGRPVIASAIGSLTELVEDCVNGKLVPSGDVTALAQAIIEMSENREAWSVMGKAARERYLLHHTPELHMDKLLTLFSQTKSLLI